MFLFYYYYNIINEENCWLPLAVPIEFSIAKQLFSGNIRSFVHFLKKVCAHVLLKFFCQELVVRTEQIVSSMDISIDDLHTRLFQFAHKMIFML